jgi:CTD kinase subunit alpha
MQSLLAERNSIPRRSASPIAPVKHVTVLAPPPPAPPPVVEVRPILPPGEVYERLACVGEGTYGKVYKARNAEDGSVVAMKRIRMEGEKDGFPVTAMREIKLLQGLKHENVIGLVEMMVSKGKLYLHPSRALTSEHGA